MSGERGNTALGGWCGGKGPTKGLGGSNGYTLDKERRGTGGINKERKREGGRSSPFIEQVEQHNEALQVAVDEVLCHAITVGTLVLGGVDHGTKLGVLSRADEYVVIVSNTRSTTFSRT
ncbi:hypothetical protein ABZP36_000111 [Zizania latifolia]